MRSITPRLAICAAALLLPGAAGAAGAGERPTAYDELIELAPVV